MEKLLRLSAVKDFTGLSRSGLYVMVKEGTFPRPVKIGLRAVAWRSSDVSKWIDERCTITELEDLDGQA